MSDLPRDELTARLAAALGRIARRTRPTHGELSVGHFSTLATIVRFGPQRPSDLARAERTSAPTMTRIVSVLESRHLVERHQTPDDARSVTIEITAEGRRVLDQARVEQCALVAELLEVLDADQLELVAAAVEALEVVAAAAVGRTMAPTRAG
jgi:DNA-binding MarR family transcriptional regulator